MAIRLENQTSRTTLPVFGTVVALLGLPLALGGGWLAALGGSWYYLLAGAGLLITGTQLVRGRYSGAWWFALVFLGTLAWTIAEAGLDYWRWIPRFGLIVVLASFLSLRLPRISGGRSRLLGRSLAALCAVIFVAAFALAFLPHGVTRNDAGLPSGAEATVLPLSAGEFTQPADAPADGDWAAWGRSNSALRFSPLTQINRTNVANLERAWEYRTGDLPENRWGAETTPLKIGDTLYLCTPRNILIAIDAGTGEERWRFDPQVPDSAIPYTAACRGVAWYEMPPAGEVADIELPGVDDTIAEAAAEDADDRTEADADADAEATTADTDPPLRLQLRHRCTPRIISGTLDGRLIAVDAGT
ncbi:MAG: membrane-bound PQQ-dependent dehydrogenase, glucose/quinate/shikimate family, partial [Woeseiaceae bacterium]